MKSLFIFFAWICLMQGLANAQSTHWLIQDRDTFQMEGTPFFSTYKEQVQYKVGCVQSEKSGVEGCRFYYQLKNDSLFLQEVYRGKEEKPLLLVSLDPVQFPELPVFMRNFHGTYITGSGNMVDYAYGNLKAVFEFEKEHAFFSGKLIQLTEHHNYQEQNFTLTHQDSLLKFLCLHIQWETLPDSVMTGEKIVVEISGDKSGQVTWKNISGTGSAAEEAEAFRLAGLMKYPLFYYRGKPLPFKIRFPVYFSTTFQKGCAYKFK